MWGITLEVVNNGNHRIFFEGMYTKNGDVPLAKLKYQRWYVIGIDVHDLFLGLSLFNGIPRFLMKDAGISFTIYFGNSLCSNAIPKPMATCLQLQTMATNTVVPAISCQHNNEFVVVLTAQSYLVIGGLNHFEKWWSSSMGRMTSHVWNGK